MKFTHKDLANSVGLKIGDRIKVIRNNDIYEVRSDYRLYLVGGAFVVPITNLANEEFEILLPKKKLGDMRCKDFETCDDCPLKLLKCYLCNSNTETLYSFLDVFGDDQELYDLYKKRLDKEVE